MSTKATATAQVFIIFNYFTRYRDCKISETQNIAVARKVSQITCRVNVVYLLVQLVQVSDIRFYVFGHLVVALWAIPA